MEKQNKVLKILVGLLLIFILLLVGCIVLGNQQIKNSATENKVSIKEDDTRDYVYDADYKYNNKYNEIELSYSETYVTKEGLGIEYGNSGKILLNDLKVPYFNFNTTDAKNVNLEIKRLYEKWAREFDDISENPNCGTIVLDYKTYYTKDTVSVVIVAGSQCTDVMHPEYFGYTFNLKTGERLNFEQVIMLTSYDKDTTLNKIETEIKKYINDNIPLNAQKGWNNVDGSDGDSTIDSLKYLKSSVENNSLVYFLDANSKLNIISRVYIAAGSGHSMHLFVVE